MKLKMKKVILILILIIMTLIPSFVFANTEDLNLNSKAVFLMDNESGKILYSENADKQMYPASTTKILTAILALENCKLDDVITINYDAVMSIPEGYSSANLQVGEKFTVEQLLQLLLVHSANDAANTLAFHVGGSLDSFVAMMNTKLSELQLSNSHFTNTYGLHEDDHYTTAHDLAVLMQYCIKNEDFRRIAGSASCAIPATNQYGPRKYTSTNELLIPNNRYYYPNIIAGKTGFTTPAGECLVSLAYKNGVELIAVVLGGKTVNGVSARFKDTKTLYEYGFSHFSKKMLLKSGEVATQIEVSNATKDTKNLDLLISDDVSTLLSNDFSLDSLSPEITLNEEISAPIMEGDVLGKIKYSIDGISYSSDLVASHLVEESHLLTYVICIVFASIVVFVFCIVISKKKKSRSSRKRWK